MNIDEAIALIRFGPSKVQFQKWADLGCGSGLFTKALANLLPGGSWIHAIDADAGAISEVPDEYSGVGIKKSIMDFTSKEIAFHEMDGIMMANSLHYVKGKYEFVKRMMDSIKIGGYFLLVDYDTNKANHWVPYPLSIAVAGELFLKCGAASFEVLNRRKSIFGERWMYAALVAM